ncbi:SCP2 sterol-binding domain-containing protein [Halomarina halobia]|uniref:SCP2 sterol-binding domain-containing protein n=1 Tax=Halomarina halobia TaxID=3033386 RepID=A0ABD6ADK1_9EURY|nr:SCP2 sterol-binding domain-containing protein [Halomarina sp. PSR21]
MAYDFPTEEWIERWEEVVANDEDYRETSRGWGVDFNGNFVFHLRADDRLPEDRYFFVGLEDGDTFGCRAVDDPEETDYGFVYRGDYRDWVRMTQGEIGAIDGLMSGTFDIDGDMQKVLQYSDAAARLVECSNEVESTSPIEARYSPFDSRVTASGSGIVATAAPIVASSPTSVARTRPSAVNSSGTSRTTSDADSAARRPLTGSSSSQWTHASPASTGSGARSGTATCALATK